MREVEGLKGLLTMSKASLAFSQDGIPYNKMFIALFSLLLLHFFMATGKCP